MTIKDLLLQAADFAQKLDHVKKSLKKYAPRDEDGGYRVVGCCTMGAVKLAIPGRFSGGTRHQTYRVIKNVLHDRGGCPDRISIADWNDRPRPPRRTWWSCSGKRPTAPRRTRS
jgi:hypothetical protein